MAEILVIIWVLLPIPSIWLLVKYLKQQKELKRLKNSEDWLNSNVEGKSDQITDLESQNTKRNSSIEALARRVIQDNLKFLSKHLTMQNYATSRNKLDKVIEFCGKHSYIMLHSEKEPESVSYQREEIGNPP